MVPLLLAGCALGPDYARPDPTLPATWAGAGAMAGTRALDAGWWRVFGDALLSDLVERALAANSDLKLARARLRAARAAAVVAGATRLPNIEASVARTQSTRNGRSVQTGYSAGFDASWELDLFGGARRAAEAASADAESTEATLAATAVSVAAEVARLYVDVRTQQARIEIAQANLGGQVESLQITEWRAEAGLAPRLDVEQARASVEQTRAQVPSLRAALAQTRHALALILGEAPAALDQALAPRMGQKLPEVPGDLAIGIPADLLRRRPDIIAAERSLAAATARVASARAARYPSFGLSGSIGLEALSLEQLAGGATVAGALVGRLIAPIFDAGRLRGQLTIRSAEQQQAMVAYEASLLGAQRDVENALSAIANGRERGHALARAAAAARSAATLARQRYSAGVADFTTVLDSDRTRQTIEDAVATNDGALFTAVIQLYKALGGGWSANPNVKGRDGR